MSAQTSDPTPGNNSAAAIITTSQSADLALADQAPPTVLDGQPYTYTLTTVNHGPSDATGTTLTQTLPGGVTFVSASSGCTQSGATMNCVLGALPSGQSATVTVTVIAEHAVSSTDSATVASSVSDPNPVNNTASATVVSQPAADLGLTDQGPTSAVAGQQVTYTLTVANQGPSGATGTVVTDILPAGLTFVSANAGHGSCLASGQTVTCAVGTLPVGGQTQLTITALVSGSASGQSLTDRATVTCDQGDPEARDDSAQTTAQVADAAGLQIAKTTSTPEVVAGAAAHYLITVHNPGPSPASAVTISDPLPAGLQVLSATGDGSSCTVAGNAVTCASASLAVGASTSVSVSARVRTDQGAETIVNTATASSPQSPTVNASVPVSVAPSADLSVAKHAPGYSPAGDDITYSLVATNHGPSVSPSATVTDRLPAGETLRESVGAQCAAHRRTLTCTMSRLDVGESRVFEIIAGTSPSMRGQTLHNSARIGGRLPDPDPADNTSATVSTRLGSALRTPGDLVITKTPLHRSIAFGDGATFMITVANHSPLPATHVDVLDAPHDSYVEAAMHGARGPCHAMSCAIGTIAAGRSVRVWVHMVPDHIGSFVNEASVPSAQRGTTPARATATATVQVTPRRTRLEIIKRALRSRVHAGREDAYRITVRNTGPAAAAAVRICDAPAMAMIVTAAPGARYIGGLPCTTMPMLRAGHSYNWVVHVRFVLSAHGPQSNHASVTAANARGAKARATVTVIPAQAVNPREGVTG